MTSDMRFPSTLSLSQLVRTLVGSALRPLAVVVAVALLATACAGGSDPESAGDQVDITGGIGAEDSSSSTKSPVSLDTTDERAVAAENQVSVDERGTTHVSGARNLDSLIADGGEVSREALGFPDRSDESETLPGSATADTVVDDVPTQSIELDFVAADDVDDVVVVVDPTAPTDTVAPPPAETAAVPADVAPTPPPPPPRSTATTAGPSPLASLPFGPGEATVWVATAKPEVGFVPAHEAPGGLEFDVKYQYLDGTWIDYQMLNPTYFGGPLALLVVSGSPSDEWVQVQLPVRPTGTTAWVESRFFDFSENDWYVQVNVSNNQVRVWQGTELKTETAAVTGRSDRPTPLARTYIDEKVPGPNSAYGPWILTLASFSESVNTFGGALPKLALHGTHSPELMGQYASSGCIRLPNSVIQLLADTVPVGTRVDIVRS